MTGFHGNVMMLILSSIPTVSLWAERFKFGNRWEALTFIPLMFENGKSELLFLGTLYWSSKGCSFKWEVNFEWKYSPHHFFHFHHSTYRLIDINLLFNFVVLLKVLFNSAVKKKILCLNSSILCTLFWSRDTGTVSHNSHWSRRILMPPLQ